MDPKRASSPQHVESEQPAEQGTEQQDERERDPRKERDRSIFERVKRPQITTKMQAHQSSVFLAGVEVAVRVNHVDPWTTGTTTGKNDVKTGWVTDGQNVGFDFETVLKRKHLPKNMVLELQGPGLIARANSEEPLPVRLRFAGVGLAASFIGDLPQDDTPPRAEVKIEVRLTEKSIGSLAALAGASNELQQYTAELAGTQAASTIAEVLATAVPVVSSVIAGVSIRRAAKTLQDDTTTTAMKTLSVLRALADVTTVFFPLAGVLANLSLVGASIGVARREARRAAQAQGPPGGGSS